ncbi:DNA polymerase III subunit gamma/tau [Alteromonas sp. 345S023]|uniref:DNA-directed DNA polymerase n=1 Tax=Alteromonas profundi TaxID=2696062 RepID=A0A7X5LPK5_9ALTE|nr:DNA polymerase III subunit gamma/tau [Alteromonas profundi]NDV93217.1 DNA polymerase III subunit gamma/tau [Alteromonas profundi]
MSYQVLARKWRPGKFSELVGQEHVVAAISNALDNDRLHHAYLFTGTRGVGKTTIARIFSKSLNCEQGQGANPCGQCNTCREIEQGNYVDLLEIDAASRTKVEDTRELLDNVQYKPTRGRYKVYLIDEVHMLSKHSFNALLKTLEEPPPHVKFLLATTDPQKLPVTILSRCLQFNLKALSREQIVGQLTHILEQEALPFEANALTLLARAAQGSMRDALSLTDQAIAQGDNAVNAAVVTDMLGLMDKNQLLKILHAVVNKTAADVMQLVQDIAEQAPDYSLVHAELASTLHQIALTQWVPEACKLETTSAKAIYQLAKTISAEHVQLLYQIALQGRKDLPLAIDGRSALEMTLMRMMSFAPSKPVSGTEETIRAGKSEQDLPVSDTRGTEGTADPLDKSTRPSAPAADVINTTQSERVSEPEEQNDDQASKHNTNGSLSVPPAKEDNGPSENEGNPYTAESARSDSSSSSAAIPTKEIPNETSANVDIENTDAMKNASQAMPQPPFDEMPPMDAYENDMPPADYQDASAGFDDDYNTLQTQVSTDDSHNAQSSVTKKDPAEQLTTTADMLALRQRLKQRKDQASSEEAKKQAPAKDDGFVNRLSRAAQTKVYAPDEAGNHSAESDRQGDNTAGTTPSLVSQNEQALNSHNLPAHARDTVTSADESEHSDAPPWSINDTQATPAGRVEDALPGQSHSEKQSVDDASEVVEHLSVSDTAEQASPQNTSIDEQTYRRSVQDELKAYLDDGTKLVHASQIDNWSQLVEQMPVAGLLKQLVLHASFSKNGEQVALEIDESQAHLLNESAKQQLLEALHHTLGENTRIEISLGSPSETPFAIQQNIQAMRQAHAHSVIETDETIQALLSTFDASVITDTVKAR